METKPCRQCGVEKSLSQFRACNTKHGFYQTCKDCCKTTASPEQKAFYYWKAKLKKAYNLTPDQYYSMLKDQNGGCAICSTTNPGAKKSYFCVDHCHHTGTIRGLLCTSCNIGIGNLKDSRMLLQNALRYLDGKPSSDDAKSPSASFQRSKTNVEKLDL